MRRRIRNALLVLGGLTLAFAALVAWEMRRPPDYTLASGRTLREHVAGRWDWTTRDLPCSDSSHTIAFPTDSTMTITSEYTIIDDSTGTDLTVATYDIRGETPTRIQGAIRGESRRTKAGDPVVWELILTGPDSYTWHRTDWPAWGRTPSIMRCTRALAGDIQAPDEPGFEDRDPYVLRIALADFYRGFLVNNQLPDIDVPVELSVFSRTDTSITGYMHIGKPLDLSGLAYVADASGDSMYLIVDTPLDTLALASATRVGTLGGEYWVSQGRNLGLGGSWELSPAPHTSSSTLIAVSATIALTIIFAILLVSLRGAQQWWNWRWRRLPPLSDGVTTSLAGLRGWLLFFVLGLTIGVIARTVSIFGQPSMFGDSWMLGAAVPGFRPLLIMEGTFDFLYALGALVGLVLVFRRSAAAPLYVVIFLAMVAAYAITDIASSVYLRETFMHVFGEDAGARFDREVASAMRSNRQVAMWAMIWMLYWTRSKRVAATFDPAKPTSDSRSLPAVSTDYSLTQPERSEVIQ